MTATLIPAATETDWLEARRRGVTASEIAVIMGLSPYSSPYALYHRKLGLLGDQPDSDAMALGRYLEQYVCDRFAERYEFEFSLLGNGRTLFAHPDRPWQLATPDRVLYNAGDDEVNCCLDHARSPVAVLEAKTAASYDGWGDDGTDLIPVHYRAQVLWQMDVMDVTAGYVAALFLHSRKVRVYQLAMDGDAEADLKIMRDAAQEFLNYHVGRRNPPPVDWRPATSDALKALHPSVEDRAVEAGAMPVIRYRAACRAYKLAEERKKLAENRLRQLLGNGRRIVLRGSYVPDRNGVGVPEVIARRDVYDVREHVRKAHTVDKIVPVNPRESS